MLSRIIRTVLRKNPPTSAEAEDVGWLGLPDEKSEGDRVFCALSFGRNVITGKDEMAYILGIGRAETKDTRYIYLQRDELRKFRDSLSQRLAEWSEV